MKRLRIKHSRSATRPQIRNERPLRMEQNATLYNGATYAAGEVGQAFSFDGVNDRASIADSPS